MARTFEGDPNAIATILEARIKAKLNRVGNVEDVRFKKAFVDIGNLIATQAQVNITKQGLVDTSRLWNSIRARFIGKGLMAIGSFGVPYARIHEFGGIIEPKTKKWLTIPTSQFKFRKAPDVPNLFFVQKSANRAMLLQNNGSGRPVLAFNLRKRVEIKAKPYLAPAIVSTTDRAIETLATAVREVLGGN